MSYILVLGAVLIVLIILVWSVYGIDNDHFTPATKEEYENQK